MIGDRIKLRLEALGMSQSALARAIGVTQGTINSLVSGRSRSSSHLHVIARELQTTIAYLTGETDDPDAGPQTPASLPADDRNLLGLFAALNGSDRAVIVKVVQAYVEKEARPPALVKLPDELTLTAMFRGILDHVDASLSKDEQAQLLAELLPIALPATVGARPDLAYRTPEEDQDTASRHAAVSTR